MRTFLFALGLSLSSLVSAHPVCGPNVAVGAPVISAGATITYCRGAYWTIYSPAKKVPMLSAYVLEPAHTLGCEKRDSTFSQDDDVPTPRAEKSDYYKSGFDIGHMVSATDLEYTAEAQRDAAKFINAAPQVPGFNRGIWKKLESATRGWASSRNVPIQVYVGPIISDKDQSVGDNKVVIPHAFYRILVDTKTNEVQAFVLKNQGASGDLKKFIVPVARIEELTGIHFNLPKSAVEKPWPITKKTVTKSCSVK